MFIITFASWKVRTHWIYNDDDDDADDDDDDGAVYPFLRARQSAPEQTPVILFKYQTRDSIKKDTTAAAAASAAATTVKNKWIEDKRKWFVVKSSQYTEHICLHVQMPFRLYTLIFMICFNRKCCFRDLLTEAERLAGYAAVS